MLFPVELSGGETIGETLCCADFFIISILPGTFDELEADVHMPEQYGIYQSVGNTAGAGGIVWGLRTISGICRTRGIFI